MMAACVAGNSTEIELEKSLENRNDQEETEDKTDDSSFPSEDEIFNQIKESFGESSAKSFREQDATQLIVIQDLLTRDAESGIFEKLQLSFGQTVRFKKEFSHLLPSVPSTSSTPKPGNGNSKPTMGQLSSFTPALRRVYLTKRKQVGGLASAHWNYTFPKFNNPERRAQLAEFANKISEECAVPSVGFNVDGIMKHIQDYFSEQRRYKKRKQGDNTDTEISPISKKPKLPKFPEWDGIKESDNKDMQDSNSSTASTLSPFASENEEHDDDQDPPPSQPSTAEEDINIQLSSKLCKMIVKAVCGRVLSREEITKLLNKKFSVASRNLTSLTPSQLMEVFSKKLIRHKYVEIPDEPADCSKLQLSMIKVHKEIEI